MRGYFRLLNKKDKHGENKNHKPWFNQECRTARNVYKKERRLYNKYKTSHYKIFLYQLYKYYKQTMKFQL